MSFQKIVDDLLFGLIMACSDIERLEAFYIYWASLIIDEKLFKYISFYHIGENVIGILLFKKLMIKLFLENLFSLVGIEF